MDAPKKSEDISKSQFQINKIDALKGKSMADVMNDEEGYVEDNIIDMFKN